MEQTILCNLNVNAANQRSLFSRAILCICQKEIRRRLLGKPVGLLKRERDTFPVDKFENVKANSEIKK